MQVSGYNGAFSTQPYLLQANVLGGETAPSCPGGISYPNPLPDASQGVATPPSDLNVAIPSNVNTLFLVNTQRMSAAFGSAFDDPADPSQETVVTDLNSIAADSGAGVYGAVVPVDSYSGVQQAYAAWNTNPCSVDAANGVVAAIGAVVDQLRAQYPTIQNIVIVGADDQIPLARIADGATQSNERDYGAATFAGREQCRGGRTVPRLLLQRRPLCCQPAARGRERHALHAPARRGAPDRVGTRDRGCPLALCELERQPRRDREPHDRLLVPHLRCPGGGGQPRRQRTSTPRTPAIS